MLPGDVDFGAIDPSSSAVVTRGRFDADDLFALLRTT